MKLKFLLMLLSISYLIVYINIFDSKLDVGGDNYGYLNLSQSISDGNGYSSPNSRGNSPVNWFPPGYSVLLTLVKQDVIAAKVMNGVLYFLAIIGVCVSVFTLTKDVFLSFISSIFLVLNPGLMRLSTVIYSEIPFVFTTIAVLVVLLKYPKWIPLSILTAMAIYLRAPGFAIAGAVFIYLFFRESKGDALKYFGGTFILYLPYMIRNHIHGLKGRYVSQILSANTWRPEEGMLSTGGVIQKIGINIQEVIIKGFPKAMFPITENHSLIIGIIVLMILFYGAYKIKKYNLFFIAYIVLNILILLMWDHRNGVRYIWPLVPILYICFFMGAWELIKLVHGKTKYILGFIVLLPFFIAPLKQKIALSESEYSQQYKEYIELASLIGKQNHPEWMVVCRKPEIFHYYSKTYTSHYKYSLNDKELIKQFEDLEADFVVIDALGYSSTPRYLVPAIQNNADKFRLISKASQTNTYLFQFK